MTWDTKANILTYINTGANGYISAQGDGSMYWASRKYLLIAPKADPFVEDHVTPLVSSLVSGPFAKAALVPTLLAGGLVAVIARRQSLADADDGGGVMTVRRASSSHRSRCGGCGGPPDPGYRVRELLRFTVATRWSTDACAGCHRAHTAASSITWTTTDRC